MTDIVINITNTIDKLTKRGDYDCHGCDLTYDAECIYWIMNQLTHVSKWMTSTSRVDRIYRSFMSEIIKILRVDKNIMCTLDVVMKYLEKRIGNRNVIQNDVFVFLHDQHSHDDRNISLICADMIDIIKIYNTNINKHVSSDLHNSYRFTPANILCFGTSLKEQQDKYSYINFDKNDAADIVLMLHFKTCELNKFDIIKSRTILMLMMC